MGGADLSAGTALALNILETVSTYVLGATLRETREMRVQRDQEQAGISRDEWEPLRDAWHQAVELAAGTGAFAAVPA